MPSWAASANKWLYSWYSTADNSARKAKAYIEVTCAGFAIPMYSLLLFHSVRSIACVRFANDLF